MLLTKLGGGELAEGIVGPSLVVFDHPPPCGFADVFQAREQVLVEDFLAEGPVEALDVGVLVGLAGLDVLEGHALAFRPLDEGLAKKLRAIVGAQHLRQTALLLQLLEDAHQAGRRDRRVDLDVNPSRLKSSAMLKVRKERPSSAHRS